MAELLKGPLNETLKSPIPSGTTLLSLKVEGTRAFVDLSLAYSTLSGVALTLADCAITLTLTQLPEILSVKITVRGQELAYRDRQVFTTRGVLLAPEEDVVGTCPRCSWRNSRMRTPSGRRSSPWGCLCARWTWWMRCGSWRTANSHRSTGRRISRTRLRRDQRQRTCGRDFGPARFILESNVPTRKARRPHENISF